MNKLDRTLAMMAASDFENNADTQDTIQTALRLVKENNGIVKHIGGGDNMSAVHSLVINSVGDLNLSVTRRSANINLPLPFVLFGLNDSQGGYTDSLKGQVPAGITLVVTNEQDTGNKLFTYTETASGEIDVIAVSNLGNINYLGFLNSMNNNYFKTKYFLLSISDETQNLQQFGQPLLFGLLSALGLTKANQLVLRSRTNSWQFRKDRIEAVLPEQKIVPDFSFVMNIVPVIDFVIGFDFFMSERKNLNRMAGD